MILLTLTIGTLADDQPEVVDSLQYCYCALLMMYYLQCSSTSITRLLRDSEHHLVGGFWPWASPDHGGHPSCCSASSYTFLPPAYSSCQPQIADLGEMFSRNCGMWATDPGPQDFHKLSTSCPRQKPFSLGTLTYSQTILGYEIP